jgi:hypothetical protein
VAAHETLRLTSARVTHSPPPASAPGTRTRTSLAVSADDAWAVGEATGVTDSHALIAHWDGRSWRRITSPAVGAYSLSAVGASSPRNAGVAGTGPGPYGQLATFIARWNGRKWQRTPSPSPGFRANVELNGIAVASPTRAWAVGWYLTRQGGQDTLVERWNGTAWQQLPSPDPGGTTGGYDIFNAVAASRARAWAAGLYNSARQHAPLSSTLISRIR